MSFDNSLDPVGLAETGLLSVNVSTGVVPFWFRVSTGDCRSFHPPEFSAPASADVWMTLLRLDIVALRRASPSRPGTRLTPLPAGDLRHVIAVLANVLLVFE